MIERNQKRKCDKKGCRKIIASLVGLRKNWRYFDGVYNIGNKYFCGRKCALRFEKEK